MEAQISAPMKTPNVNWSWLRPDSADAGGRPDSRLTWELAAPMRDLVLEMIIENLFLTGLSLGARRPRQPGQARPS